MLPHRRPACPESIPNRVSLSSSYCLNFTLSVYCSRALIQGFSDDLE